VTVIDTRPSLTEATPVPILTPHPPLDGVSVLDTTELRWFSEGQLPLDVLSWFTRGGSVGLTEERCDTYRLDGRLDTGVKRRFQETLELKVRRSLGEHLELGSGLTGRLEVWRKWSPAECLASAGHEVEWADVRKLVVKRRFEVDGSEIELSEGNRAATGAGCDVEVVAITLDDVDAWSFAFAAFGPVETRREALVASWGSLVGDGPIPEQFGPFFGQSCGYPEWLALVTARSGAVSTCDLGRA
jgi:hypothetical protein